MFPLGILDLGRQRYGETLDLQRSLAKQRVSGALDHDVLLLVEHPTVVTLGRGTKASSLPLSAAQLEARGMEVYEVERGGDATVHEPGQLVGYPILDLHRHRQDLHWYLRQLEAVLIEALTAFDIPAERNPGLTGVWTGGRKIASIGIHVKQWVTLHGFALNVINELKGFDWVVPCGISGVIMTSVAREAGRSTDQLQLWNETKDAVIGAMGRQFDLAPTRDPELWTTPPQNPPLRQ